MKAALLLILTLSLNSIYSQTDKTESRNPDSVQSSVTNVKTDSKEENKTNNNKSGKFYQYIAENIIPPTDPNFVGGRVIVDFVIKIDGTPVVTKINNDLGYGISQQIIEIFEKCKKFKPATKDGIPVEVKLSLPITIQGKQN